jgi:hypothetical protein
MRLIHHDKQIITFDPDRLYPNRDHDQYFKPHGLWISDEDDYGWSHWCTGEQWGTETLVYEHLVELTWDNNVLFISTIEGLDKFHEQFKVHLGIGNQVILGGWIGHGSLRSGKG